MGKEIKIEFTPHKSQKEIIDLFNKIDCKILTISCGRRFGKSFLSQYLLLKHCITNKNVTTIYVTPEYGLAIEFFKEFSRKLEGTPLVKDISAGTLSITFYNGSKIDFFSAKNPDSIRGRKYSMGVLDEAAFYTDYAIKECIMPCFATIKNPKILFISTPKGAFGSFYEFYSSALKNNKGFYYYQAPSSASPYVDETYLDLMRTSLSERAYKQEILAQFLALGDGSVFKNILNCINNSPEATKEYYAGLDIGYNDSTVLTIINSKGGVIKQIAWSEVEYSNLIPLIVKELNQYNIVKVYVEKNGVGSPVISFLKEQYDRNKIKEWNTTNDSKNDIIESLMLSFEQCKITIPEDSLLLNELDTFEVQSTRTGKITYNAVQGSHDDRVMSLAIALRCLNDSTKKGRYSIL